VAEFDVGNNSLSYSYNRAELKAIIDPLLAK
jgi:hypothetical protein